MANPDVLEKIEIAKQAILEAQRDLEKALDELDVVPRAEKRHVTDALRDAFDRLRVAHDQLASLREMLMAE
jgi:tRNA C32,U32 (ribose-2'-O)-methylase TrmJ